jgi:cystathionine beta-lyase/cystathionine gamma-synthase
VYARYASPNVRAVEGHLASLEGAEEAVAFASGTAALHAAVHCLAGPDGCVAVPQQVYGGTAALLANELAAVGVVSVVYDVADPASLDAALARGAGLVLAEGLSNPVVRVADLPILAARAHAHGARLLVDSTFATPVVQRPLELGADLVLHSATKALGGHSDLVAGVLLGGAEDMAALRGFRKRTGAILDPSAAWLLTRGLATLALRVRAQCAGASALAAALSAHPAVARVFHPSLAQDPSHALARRLCAPGLFGSVLTLELAAGDAAARPFVAALELIQDAPSLGGVESLVSIPRVMSHAACSEAELRAAGIGAGAVRIAVGIEAPGDLVRDVERALARVAAR